MEIRNLLLHCILFIFVTLNDCSPVPRVETKLGGIVGFYDYSFNGRKYIAFEGIPYAEPPIGDLRFRPPQKVLPWTGDIVALKTGSPCLQYVHYPKTTKEKIQGAEDCLYLNIYKADAQTRLPVIIWIHGGAFQWNMDAHDGKFTGPEYLMDRNVIFVTFSYRLGPLGFLSTEDDLISGNMGLKDQSMAIQWIKENIEAFGGDPNNITLMGLSAGGVSVHYHYLSPLSKGLFKRGVSMSGSVLVPWASTEKAAEKAKHVASIVGCATSSNEEMVKCLKRRPARHIARAGMDFMPWLYNPMTPFGPVVEKSSAESPFITKKPKEIMLSGETYDVPWITGVVPEEGLYPGADFAGDEKLRRELDTRWDTLLPHILDFNYTVPLDQQVNVCKKIRAAYVSDYHDLNELTVKDVIQMISDRFYILGGVQSAKLMAEVIPSNVRFYYFKYEGAESLGPFMIDKEENYGISHGDDAAYVFGFPPVNPTTTEQDRVMQRKLLDIWVSFATNGELDFNWPIVDPSSKKLNCLRIGKLNSTVKAWVSNCDKLGNYEFWSSIDFNE